LSANGRYRIPSTGANANPFASMPAARGEIYAYGFRNPHRLFWDTVTNTLLANDVGHKSWEEINIVTRGGNYGWAVKEGTFLFNRADGTIGAPPGNNSPGSPAGLIDPISVGSNYLQYDHQDGISITGGFVYRGTAIPELIGKYVFGDLALRTAPTRADGRLFYADLATAQIKEFLLPQFAAGVLPNGLTVHGFGQDTSGELYAMVTNTPANGSGGIVYKLTAVPEPAAAVLVIAAVGWLLSKRRRLPNQ